MKTSQKWNSVTTALLVAITVIPIGVCYGRNCGLLFNCDAGQYCCEEAITSVKYCTSSYLDDSCDYIIFEDFIGLSIGAIVAIAVGGVAVIIGLITCCCCCCGCCGSCQSRSNPPACQVVNTTTVLPNYPGPQHPQPQYAVGMQTQREPHSFTNPQYANPQAYTEYYAKDTRPLI